METGLYPASPGERAMKVQEVILRAIDGRLKKSRARNLGEIALAAPRNDSACRIAGLRLAVRNDEPSHGAQQAAPLRPPIPTFSHQGSVRGEGYDILST